MAFKKVTLLPAIDDIIILERGDYGTIECESQQQKLGGVFTKMFTTLTSLFKFGRTGPSTANERDFMIFVEECFFRITNFDIKQLKYETDYDTIKFEFGIANPLAKFNYIEHITDTFIFVMIEGRVISGAKIENFKFDAIPESIFFKNGRNGDSIRLTKFEGEAPQQTYIINAINNGIEGKN